MSTLTSRDMNVERSTTRLHAPPGGKSSFSLSHDEGPGAAAAAVVKKTVVAPTPVVSAPVATPTPGQQENVVPVQKFNSSGNMAGVFGEVEKPAARRNVRAPPGGHSTFTLG